MFRRPPSYEELKRQQQKLGLRKDSSDSYHDPNFVERKQCGSCPFLPYGKGIGSCEMTEQEYYQQQAQLQANVLTKANQYCHAPILSETVNTEAPSPVCRGARNIQIQFFFRLGVIEEETDEAWRKALTALQK